MDNTKQSIYKKIKKSLLEIAARTGSRHVHIGSCLSCFDIMFQTLLYEMKTQDKFILSKGHAALSLYVILNHQKKISKQILNTYLTDGTFLGIHPSSAFPKHIPLPTGSLGHGLSFACGLSKGYSLNKNKFSPRAYCLLSDGECNEGTVWEAALFASKHKLNNLIVLIDKNDFQAFGRTKDVLGIAASVDKWQAFGFNVVECDGHALNKIKKAFDEIKRKNNRKPNVIIFKTIRGKGVRSIEDKLASNYAPILQDDLRVILNEP